MKNFLLAMVFASLLTCGISAQNSNVSINRMPTPEPRKMRITGRAIYEDSGKPLRRVEVSLWLIRDRGNPNIPMLQIEKSNALAVTNDEGEFVIDNADAGDFYVSVDVPGVLNAKNLEQFYKSGFFANKLKLDRLLQKISVVEGLDEQNVLVIAKRGGAVSGAISYSDGDPVPGVEVELLFWGPLGRDSVARTKTDERGFYRFFDVPPGEYTIRMTQLTFRKGSILWGVNDAKSLVVLYYGDTPDLPLAKKFAVTATAEENGIDITIPNRRTFSVQGKVIAKSGQLPVKEAKVIVQRKSDSDSFDYLSLFLRDDDFYTAATDDQGRFRLEDLPVGSYKLKVIPPKVYANETEANKGERGNKDLATKEIEVVVEEKNIEDLVVEVPNAITISGTIETEDKSPLTDFNLGITATDNEPSVGFIEVFPGDYKGAAKREFTIRGIVAGTYLPFLSDGESNYGSYFRSATIDGKNWLAGGFTFKEDVNVSGIRIVLAKDVGTLKGSVEFDDASELEDLFVLAAKTDLTYTRDNRSATVKPDGSFEIKIPPGEYMLVKMKLAELFSGAFDDVEKLKKRLEGRAQVVTIKPNETTKVVIKK